jgi:hypothetical protein
MQKSTSGVSISQFETNIRNMANQVRSAGGTPIILTSLTRRTFTNGQLDNSLDNVVQAAKRAAAAVGVTMLDLNAASSKYVQAIGRSNADKYNLSQGDRTHLNSHGTVVFGRWNLKRKAFMHQSRSLEDLNIRILMAINLPDRPLAERPSPGQNTTAWFPVKSRIRTSGMIQLA